MRPDWEVKKLGEILEIQRGGSPRPIKNFLTNSPDGINWIKIGDAPDGEKYIYETKEKIKPEGIRSSRLVKGGDFILSNSMSFGRPYIMKTTGCIHDGWLVLRDTNNKINQDFLYYVLSSYLVYRQFDNLASGSTVRNLNINLVSKVEIPIPPLSEQQKIVEILDKALTGIATIKANTERNLHNARELFQSYLQGIFSNPSEDWKFKTLHQVSKIFARGKSKHRPRNDKKLYGGKYPFIQTGDIRNSSHYITKYSQTYNEIGLAQSKLWPAETICITIAANIAETGILSFDACFPDSVVGVVVNTEVTNAGFVEYLLQSFKTKLQAKGKGSAQDNINMGTFENEFFPFPPLSQQQEIVKKLDALAAQTKRLESIYQEKLDKLEELKKAILQKAFNGELTQNQV